MRPQPVHARPPAQSPSAPPAKKCQAISAIPIRIRLILCMGCTGFLAHHERTLEDGKNVTSRRAKE
eukprot:329207-Prorocentrum_minimum.AAC.2